MLILVKQPGIDLLRQIGERVPGIPENIAAETQALLNDIREHEAVLGPNLFLLTDALQTIVQAAGEAVRPAEEVGRCLCKIADKYDELSAPDPFPDALRKNE